MSTLSDKTKYVAIKVVGIQHWLWFDRTKTKTEGGTFTGTEGWGDGGALTEISISTDCIEGEIGSESLQYD